LVCGDDELYIAESSEEWFDNGDKEGESKSETATDIWSPTFKFDPRPTVSDTRLAGPALFALEQTSSHPARDKLRASI